MERKKKQEVAPFPYLARSHIPCPIQPTHAFLVHLARSRIPCPIQPTHTPLPCFEPTFPIHGPVRPPNSFGPSKTRTPNLPPPVRTHRLVGSPPPQEIMTSTEGFQRCYGRLIEGIWIDRGHIKGARVTQGVYLIPYLVVFCI